MRLTKLNPETGLYEYKEKARTQEEYNEQRRAVIQRLGEFEDRAEGEWETIPDYQLNKLITYRHICSVCKTFYKDVRSHGHKYCHNCGAIMKGADDEQR